MAARIDILGVVQGVGFRPFIHKLANEHGLVGWVRNTTTGVTVHVEGDRRAIRAFFNDIAPKAPPLARIESAKLKRTDASRLKGFKIVKSRRNRDELVLISPDVATCPDCLRDISRGFDRRWEYPFTNCTNCGPRFTIIKDIPYDRPKTTMAFFRMCPGCQREYGDVTDRRYHAQPNACPVCGPHVWLERDGKVVAKEAEAVALARRMLVDGRIIAIKGIGGFHLACDALNAEAVGKLKARKRRELDKALAVMCREEEVRRLCRVSRDEIDVLKGWQRPIVLLEKRPDCPVAEDVAPRNRFLGVMLPYTPLHHLLLQESPPKSEIRPMRRPGVPARNPQSPILVMTSANPSDEPIVKDNEEARVKLGGIADFSLMHNRNIHARCDDSVVRVMGGKAGFLRRSRGYVPLPVFVNKELPEVLACGAELKNTFCLTKGHYAFVSQHVGDLSNFETYEFYRGSVEHFKRLFRVEPKIVAHDMHPDYLSTRFATEYAAGGNPRPRIRNPQSAIRIVKVQHHHAHIASCMAENGVDERVIGVALDGTGYGADGTIWGGEFLICDFTGFERFAHIKPVPQPGGDMAVREPLRMAVSHLMNAYDGDADKVVAVLTRAGRLPGRKGYLRTIASIAASGLGSSLTSSCGRLFDAVSALLGVCLEPTYEGQTAAELEMAAYAAKREKRKTKNETSGWRFDIRNSKFAIVLDPAPVFRGIVADVNRRVPVPEIALRFHAAVAKAVVEICVLVRNSAKLNTVALSGGCFQNKLLTEQCLAGLQRQHFRVLTHSKVPANDGGISLGQAMIAAAASKRKDRCELQASSSR